MPTRKFTVDTQEYPFTSHWFERDGVAMHYVDEGEGIPVVMCHGNPTWSFLYRNIIKELRGECRCIAYDMMGFGFSEHPPGFDYTPAEQVEWVRALIINHLQLDKFILVGQDWGGPVGLSIATDNPERILGLTISSSFAWKAGTVLTIFSKLLGNALSRKLILSKNLLAKHLMSIMLPATAKANKAITAAYSAPFPTPASRLGTAVFPRQLTAANPWLDKLEKRLHTLKSKPVEFVFGLKDPGTRKADMAKWLEHFPDANVQRVAQGNHFTQEDCPENYVIAIRNLLAKQR